MISLFQLPDAYLLGMGVWIVSGAAALWVLLRLRRRLHGRPGWMRAMNLGLAAWMTLFVLTLPEIWCALFYDETDSFSQTNVSKRWSTLHVKTNTDGYRDHAELPRGANDDRLHVVFAGDSFTFGHGVPDVVDRFSDLAAAELESARPGETTVSHVALPGLELRGLVDEQLPELLESGVEIDVLVYTFVLNDIEYFDERTAEHYQTLSGLDPQFFLFRDTYFYNLMYYRVQRMFRPEARDYYEYLRESYNGPPWERLEQKLDQLREFCTRRKIDLRIAVFPFLHDLGPDYAFVAAHRRLVAWCREHDVPCLDLEPVLSPHRDEGLTVNRFDAHPNERAHRLAADAMESTLLEDLFEPSP